MRRGKQSKTKMLLHENLFSRRNLSVFLGREVAAGGVRLFQRGSEAAEPWRSVGMESAQSVEKSTKKTSFYSHRVGMGR